ncbi:hypothetical protein EV421DRAFT_1743493 [Armillaria borealis]|uniref:Uncharacterized protein n=1 Tax=Armillaria borealis TaxID=47425 RepID=A0AA39IY80_9AGAR|nr:hypothetical protein EV421DRAFT_1743493 [Armillaria borealis]
MAIIKPSTHAHKTVSRDAAQIRKAELAAERAAREEDVKGELKKAERTRMERNKVLKREADMEKKKLKAARHLIAINTPRDPIPDPKPKRKGNRRHTKKVAAQVNAIDMNNLLLFLEPEKTVPGASKEVPGKCQKCDKVLLGWPKRRLVVYRQMVRRPFTPPVHIKKTRRMGLPSSSADILSSNKYENRVKLAPIWYHLSCLSEGQLNHIREKGVRFGQSIDDHLKRSIQKKFKFQKEIGRVAGDDVDVDEEEDEEDASGEEITFSIRYWLRKETQYGPQDEDHFYMLTFMAPNAGDKIQTPCTCNVGHRMQLLTRPSPSHQIQAMACSCVLPSMSLCVTPDLGRRAKNTHTCDVCGVRVLGKVCKSRIQGSPPRFASRGVGLRQSRLQGSPPGV